MIYLASPYSHPMGAMRHLRAETAAWAASWLMTHLDAMVYSPIAHGHALHQQRRLPETWEFWRERSLDMVGRATHLHILAIPGWDQSIGVAEEYARFRRCRADLIPMWRVDEASQGRRLVVSHEERPEFHGEAANIVARAEKRKADEWEEMELEAEEQDANDDQP